MPFVRGVHECFGDDVAANKEPVQLDGFAKFHEPGDVVDIVGDDEPGLNGFVFCFDFFERVAVV